MATCFPLSRVAQEVENTSILYKERLKMEKEAREKMEKERVNETKTQSESGKQSLEGLPTEDSPYVKYKDLEDYKQQGYGTQGHQQPQEGRGAGATDAPTLSGAAVLSESKLTATDAINSKGVP